MIEPLTPSEEEFLLGRRVEPLLSDADRRWFEGRRCLITGAGGSVGGELARQIASCRPKQLTVLDHSELGLFNIEQALREAWPGVPFEAALCDVTRTGSIRQILRRARPDVVFHAAAYKHVTMAERAVCPAARVNVLGTAEVLTALRDTDARFVLISSDKATAPRSVMGATKRLAEMVTVTSAANGITPLVVRFGNVLASSGSFVDTMRRRIRNGCPILLTDPEAMRYFMTLTEAASLVMKAAAFGEGGATYWLDMGEQIRMADLTGRMLDAAVSAGLSRVPVEIIGLRPGEKLVEQLATETLVEATSLHQRIKVARRRASSLAGSDSILRTLRRQIDQEDACGVLKTLATAVPDFEPSVQAQAVARAARMARRALVEPGARTA